MDNKKEDVEAKVRVRPARTLVLRVLALAVVLAILTGIVLFRDRLVGLEVLGYPGLFLVTLSSNASVAVPVPGILAVIVGGKFLNPLFVGFVAGIGAALGELVGYMLGYSGSGVLERRGFYSRVVGWMRKRGGLVVLLASTIPNPVFDVIGVAAGGLRYPVLRFFLFCWIGKTIKFLGVAYASFWGLNWLIEFVRRLYG